MQVLTFVTQKGGSGKTTALLNLAVAASKLSPKGTRILIIDLDPQRSSLAWWESRQENNIGAIDIVPHELDKAISAAKQNNFDYVFIDTAARAETVNNMAMQAADFCVLPCQPSLLDMRAAKPTIDSLKKLNRRGGFLITRANPRGFRVGDAVSALQVHSLPVCPTAIVDRTVYRDAYAFGEGVLELESEGKAAQEIGQIWNWVKVMLNKRMEELAA